MTDTQSTAHSLSAALSDLVAQVGPSLVAVQSHRSRSSGFAWGSGLIVTADEALAEEGEISVTLPGGERAAATLVGRDPTTDIALLRIERTDLPLVTLASREVRTGALVLGVGSHGGAPTAALGIVALSGEGWRSVRGGEIDARIELHLSLRRSSEGGLALDDAGGVLGMVVFGPRRRVLVIPSATLQRIAGRLQTHGRIGRGYLGLGLQAVGLNDGGVGAMVMSVDADGPGAAAKVHQGDVITSWDGKPVRSVQALLRALGPESVGAVAKLSLRRAGASVEVELTIEERPSA